MKELLKELEERRKKIIEEEGRSEMSDGFDQALEIVKTYYKKGE